MHKRHLFKSGRSKPLPYVKFARLYKTRPLFSRRLPLPRDITLITDHCERQGGILRNARGGAISYELAVLGISAVLGKAVTRRCTFCTASGN